MRRANFLWISLFFWGLALASGSLASAKTYYVATTGSDSAAGTFDAPFLTVPKAYSTAVAGDTILVRGGVYTIAATINLSKSGTSTSMYYLLAYPGERPVLDCSPMPINSSNRGIKLSGSYWYIKGFDVRKAGDNGIYVSGSYNVVEFCAFYRNSDSGMQLSGGASHNRIINCDSYYNVDPSQGNADGFSPKLDVGTGNEFRGCRSWQNSDDGFDGYLRPSDSVVTTIDSCWSFNNGYLESGSPSTGNGNGFKMGGGDAVGGVSNGDSLRHEMTLRNCLAFDNRVKGFDQNNNRGSMTMLNCTSYRNGSTNFSVPGFRRVGETLTVKNCVAFGSTGVTLYQPTQLLTNSWMSPFNVTSTDFASLDTAGVRGPRTSDGSLPDVPFMHLAAGSQLIDAGTNVGLPYLGNGPDLGAFEFNPSAVVIQSSPSSPVSYLVLSNYPNPFNPATTIEFSVPKEGEAVVRVFNLIGQSLAELFHGRVQSGRAYVVHFDGSALPSGLYFAVLESNGSRVARKLLLAK